MFVFSEPAEERLYDSSFVIETGERLLQSKNRSRKNKLYVVRSESCDSLLPQCFGQFILKEWVCVVDVLDDNRRWGFEATAPGGLEFRWASTQKCHPLFAFTQDPEVDRI